MSNSSTTGTRPGRPLVSVVMPIRNEAGRHVKALQSVLAQDYPKDALEVIVVVGDSNDDTLQLAQDVASSDPRVTVIHNPDGTTPVSLNIGFRSARGEIVGRVDGHAWIAPDFVSRAVRALASTGADGVGGLAEHVGHGRMGSAIAIAMSSRLGSGNSRFRIGGRGDWTDTVVFGMYRAELFQSVGLHDETLLRNQDDELNHRIRLGGGRLWFDPEIRSSYVVRSRIRDLWRQYRGYGAYRVHTIAKHRRPGALRQLAPPLLLAVLGSGLLVDMLRGRSIGRGLWLLYASVVGIGGVVSSRRAGRPALAPAVSLAAMIMHAAHGFGFWAEVLRRTSQGAFVRLPAARARSVDMSADSNRSARE